MAWASASAVTLRDSARLRSSVSCASESATPGVLLGVRVLLLGVALGLGRLVDLGDELLLAQVVVADRDELLLLDDLLLLGGAGQGTGGVGHGLTGVGLLLDLGLADVEGLLRLGLLLQVHVLGLRGLAVRIGLGDRGALGDQRRLGAAPVPQVGAVVLDRGDLEGVDDQALVVHRVLGLGLHLVGEGGAVTDDLLDGQGADHGAQGAGEDLLGVVVDLLLLVQEALGGLADVLDVAAHLHLGDAAQPQEDAVHRIALDLDGDLAGAQRQHEGAVEDGAHDGAAADHHPGAAGLEVDVPVGGGLRVAARDDQGLVRRGDAIGPHQHQQEDQEDDDGDAHQGEDRDEGFHGHSVPSCGCPASPPGIRMLTPVPGSRDRA